MASQPFQLRGPLAERYLIEREIGQGGMATVYLARDLRHDRLVAIKVLATDTAAVVGPERFLQEIQIIARLSHPNILPLHDSGESEGRPCYVMPFVEGESLRERIVREGAFPLEDAVQIAREIADALGHAHSHGVLHRDIKPENVLLVSGHAVVADFGVARALDRAAGDRLTATGLTLGTPQYMSPEQAAGEDLDARSDLYALGCVLYEMLTGTVPFPAPTAAASIARRLTETPPSVRASRELVPPVIDAIVTRCLARNPADRLRTAEELVRALNAAISGPTVPTLPAQPALGRRRRLAVTGFVSLAAVALAVLLWRRPAGVVGGGDPGRLMVLPFTTTGDPALGYLGEGMVDLLARNLDGVGQLHTVDPATVLTALATWGGRTLDEAGYRAVAERIGAGSYLLGSVTAIGGQLRLQARWHVLTAKGVEVGPLATVEGDPSDVLRLVDQLSARILLTRGGHEGRLGEIAALTTNSLPALKAYLAADQILRSGPQAIDSAIAGFRRAVEIDSSFALAHYRLALAADWSGRRDLAAVASRNAVARAGRLGDRDRRLLEAYAAYRSGVADLAEKGYRALLADYPDDLEATFQLADLMVTYNPIWGRPMEEARRLFERVLAYDPGFL